MSLLTSAKCIVVQFREIRRELSQGHLGTGACGRLAVFPEFPLSLLLILACSGGYEFPEEDLHS